MRHYLLLVMSLLLLLGSCRNEGDRPATASSDAVAATGVYYWRTTLLLSNKERAWLADHGIRRVYLRLFDVAMRDGEAMPNATLQFRDSIVASSSAASLDSSVLDSTIVGTVAAVLPDSVEVVPVVYIMEDVFRSVKDVEALAQRVAERVQKMGRTRSFAFTELQMDCDWTATTREPYYRFLTALRRELPGISLSSTIRLHQLTQPVPPVDRGVLMVYNTGDFRHPRGDHNPILDLRDVKPYLRHLHKYDLPLTAAYPNFSWQLLFSGDEFKGILYGTDLTDRSCFRHVGPAPGTTAPDRYEVVAVRSIVMSMGGTTLHVVPGQTVNVWRVAPDALAAVVREVEKARPGINTEAIVYHLDEANF